MRRKMAGLLVLIVSLGLASAVASRERVQRKLDDGPQLVEVDAIRQANERAPSLGADVPGR